MRCGISERKITHNLLDTLHQIDRLPRKLQSVLLSALRVSQIAHGDIQMMRLPQSCRYCPLELLVLLIAIAQSLQMLRRLLERGCEHR